MFYIHPKIFFYSTGLYAKCQNTHISNQWCCQTVFLEQMTNLLNVLLKGLVAFVIGLCFTFGASLPLDLWPFFLLVSTWQWQKYYVVIIPSIDPFRLHLVTGNLIYLDMYCICYLIQ